MSRAPHPVTQSRPTPEKRSQELQRLERMTQALSREMARLNTTIQDLGNRLDAMEAGALRERIGEASVPGVPDEPFDYCLFEQRFRGPLAEIKRRQTVYLDLFLGRGPAVDLGSGRGEFVELLSEHGIPVTGVDKNADMVSFCLRRGLRVVLGDMFDYLADLPDASVDGMTAFQLVEHLPPDQIFRLIALCGKKLKPTAPIVAETPNPLCPWAMGSFYLDPTHVRPVPPQMLRFMFERGSFEVQYLRFSAPTRQADVQEALEVALDIPPEVVLYQDYAVVARRQ